MPYIIAPKWARLAQKGILFAQYLFLVGAGIVAVTTLNSHTMDVAGWTLIIGGAVAGFGALTYHFHFELVPIWFLLAALMAAVGVLLTNDSYTSALLVTALMPSLASRLLHLSLVAKKTRKRLGTREIDGR